MARVLTRVEGRYEKVVRVPMDDRVESADVMGLVPAGGRSSRFGSPKALHVLEGRTLARHVADALLQVLQDVRQGLSAASDPAVLPGLPVVLDDPGDSGPVGSLRGAFLSTGAEWVLAVACDMPGVTGDAVRRLVDGRRDDVDVVVAVDARGALHPLFACYRRTCMAEMDRYLAARRRSMRGFVLALRRVEIEFDDRVVWNVNRPQDLLGPAENGDR